MIPSAKGEFSSHKSKENPGQENGSFKASLRKPPLFSRLQGDRDRKKVAYSEFMSEVNSLQNSNIG